MHIYTDNVCNQEVFQALVSSSLFEGQNMKRYIHNWWKITVSVDNTLLFCSSLFPMWHFLPHFSSYCSFVQDLRCSEWWELIIQSGLGHCVVWYVVMNVLGLFSQAIKRWMQDVLIKTSVSTSQITWFPTLEDYNLKNCILHLSCIVSLPYLLQTNWLHVLGSQYTLLFYIVFIFYYDLSRNMLEKI
jgi:hypothetical protein